MLTQFQRTYLEQIQQQPDFKHFCYDYLNDSHERSLEREKTLNFLFITTDNKLHAHRVGRKRLVAKITH